MDPYVLQKNDVPVYLYYIAEDGPHTYAFRAQSWGEGGFGRFPMGPLFQGIPDSNNRLKANKNPGLRPSKIIDIGIKTTIFTDELENHLEITAVPYVFPSKNHQSCNIPSPFLSVYSTREAVKKIIDYRKVRYGNDRKWKVYRIDGQKLVDLEGKVLKVESAVEAFKYGRCDEYKPSSARYVKERARKDEYLVWSDIPYQTWMDSCPWEYLEDGKREFFLIPGPKAKKSALSASAPTTNGVNGTTNGTQEPEQDQSMPDAPIIQQASIYSITLNDKKICTFDRILKHSLAGATKHSSVKWYWVSWMEGPSDAKGDWVEPERVPEQAVEVYWAERAAAKAARAAKAAEKGAGKGKGKGKTDLQKTDLQKTDLQKTDLQKTALLNAANAVVDDQPRFTRTMRKAKGPVRGMRIAKNGSVSKIAAKPVAKRAPTKAPVVKADNAGETGEKVPAQRRSARTRAARKK